MLDPVIRPLISSAVIVLVAMLCMAKTVSAGSVLMSGVSASAQLLAENQIAEDENIDAELFFPSSDTLQAESGAGDTAEVGWTFTNDANTATLAIDLEGNANAIGKAQAQVEVAFITDRSVNYILTVKAESVGLELSAQLNGEKIFFAFDPTDPFQSGERTFAALLPPGSHLYTVAATTGIGNGFGLSVIGQTKLELSAAAEPPPPPGTAVPLPAGVWSGLALLAALAAPVARRRLAASFPAA